MLNDLVDERDIGVATALRFAHEVGVATLVGTEEDDVEHLFLPAVCTAGKRRNNQKGHQQNTWPATRMLIGGNGRDDAQRVLRLPSRARLERSRNQPAGRRTKAQVCVARYRVAFADTRGCEAPRVGAAAAVRLPFPGFARIHNETGSRGRKGRGQGGEENPNGPYMRGGELDADAVAAALDRQLQLYERDKIACRFQAAAARVLPAAGMRCVTAHGWIQIWWTVCVHRVARIFCGTAWQPLGTTTIAFA